MKIKFRQPSVGWCSVYTLANLFNNHNALDFITEERFKGSTDKEELEVLAHIGQDFKISNVMFSTPLVKGPPLNYVWNTIKKITELDQKFVEEMNPLLLPFIPFLLVVKLNKKAELYHRVAVIAYKDRYFYLDPYKENILEIKNNIDLVSLFVECVGIDRLSMDTEEGERYQILFGERLGHYWLRDI